MNKIRFICVLQVMFCVMTGVAEMVLDPTPELLLSNVNIGFLEVADFNRDGQPDIAVATGGETNQVLVFYQSNGTYPASADVVVDIEDSPRGLAVGDFNGDGLMDVAVTTRNWLWLFLGAKDYVMEGRHVNGFANNNQRRRHGLIATRLIPDSRDTDFLVGPVWRKWRGGVSMRNGYFHGPESNNNGALALADLDGDGYPDAVFSVPDENKLRLYYGPFLSMRGVRPELLKSFVELTAPDSVRMPRVADMNDDGRPDILAVGRDEAGTYGVYLYFQNSPYDFTPGTDASWVIAAGKHPLSLAVADVDGDGLADILVLERNRRGARLLALLQKASGVWPESIEDADQIVELGAVAHALWPVELNGTDELPDLALSVGTPVPDRLMVLRNTRKRGVCHENNQK